MKKDLRLITAVPVLTINERIEFTKYFLEDGAV